ncbi:substrate-binding periplasmic protein [Pseudomonas sp. JBR1]|uniref:substrate-binding periplasmic protein n=1 Tax=Pseudomonas sp. JBR1 TaxID=3020907 RepID=UPI002305346D|nr:transporter substrate-binding domain-containing protein [Pseudomonas sp. JBR1]WCE07744.1 transporter substrate-binding domain-containing protein [Pseudomonas sp. JBR1]
MRKLWLPIASVLLSCALGMGTAQAELPPGYRVVLLTENFPPFNMAVDDKNFARDEAIDGISTDLVREMFKRAGIDYSLSLRFPWDRLYNLTLESPNYGLFSVSRTEARGPLFKWVGPLGKTRKVLMALPGSTIRVPDLAAAAKLRVGAYKNSAVSQMLKDKGVVASEVLRDQENIARLQKNEIDVWATTDVVGRYLAKQQGVSNLQTLLSFQESDLYLALNKDTPDEVVNRLQQALDAMRQEGVVDSITRNYL